MGKSLQHTLSTRVGCAPHCRIVPLCHCHHHGIVRPSLHVIVVKHGIKASQSCMVDLGLFAVDPVGKLFTGRCVGQAVALPLPLSLPLPPSCSCLFGLFCFQLGLFPLLVQVLFVHRPPHRCLQLDLVVG